MGSKGLLAVLFAHASNRLKILFCSALVFLTGCGVDKQQTSGSDSESLGSQQSAIKIAAPNPKNPPPKAALPSKPPAPGTKKTVWVLMRQQPSLTQAKSQKDWKARGRAVYQVLTSNAQTSQAALSQSLTNRSIKHEKYWIVNAIKLSADQALIDELGRRSDVAKVVPDKTYHVPPVARSARVKGVNGTEWGIDAIRAPEVWSQLGVFGDGIVVGSIDTGVEFNHPALVEQYRGNLGSGNFDHNYNWFDPASVCGFPSDVPCDNASHGTHTMGTMVGDDHAGNQVGVAPHARWMTAKGCESFSCSLSSLVTAGQWMLAPTDLSGQNPLPELRPHIVNNSWGSDSGGDDFYRAIVQSWVAAGIFPAFSNGNAGPFCGSVGSPADYPESFTSGAFDVFGNIADFSSRGPSLNGLGKPAIAAPGVSVRSSVPGGGYDFFQGTSMASPHLAGAVALLWSGSDALVRDIDATRALLSSTAIDVNDTSCGGTPENNNVWGEGKLDAFAAVDQAPRGPTGYLAGHVLASGGGAVSNALVVASAGTVSRSANTDAEGAYNLRLPIGTYDVSVSAFGFLPLVQTGFDIVQDQVTAGDLTLNAAPAFPVSGHVRDGLGQPISGVTVSIDGTPIPSVLTGSDGAYAFDSVPAATYTVRAEQPGCLEPQSIELVVDATEVLDFALTSRSDAFGYSCRRSSFDFIEATNPLPISGDDDITSVALPFPFTYYGSTFQSVNVATNGFVAFQSSFAQYFNTPIPDPSDPNGAVFAYWDDLYVGPGASVLTEVVGSAPNRRFVVEWRDVELLGQPGVPLTFEIVLHENGQISLQYRSLGSSPAFLGGNASVGIEDSAGTVGLQYSFNEPVLAPGLSVLYTAPPIAIVRGSVIDANDGLAISGAVIEASQGGAVVRSTQTDSAGSYQFAVPPGTITLNVLAARYSSAQRTLTVQDGSTYVADFALQTPRLTVSTPVLKWLIPANEVRTRSFTIGNTGSSNLTFELKEAGGARQATALTRLLTRNSSAQPNAATARNLFKGAQPSGMAPSAAGDLLFRFTPPLSQVWGVGYTGNLWLGEFSNRRDVEFSVSGNATGRSWFAPVPGVAAGDMAFDTNRNLVCQVDIGGDNGIHCFDPNSGSEQASIVGPFQWTNISQRGLAYRPDDDSFYIGGWNEGVLYHVAGLGSATPGAVLGSCMPPDGGISGLGWNAGAEVIWAATNSFTDTIYQLDPNDCTVLSTLAHPSPGGSGAGLEVDEAGNLWTVSQNTGEVLLMDSGVPAITDVPWLGLTPETGTVAPGATKKIAITVNSSGLSVGQYLATVIVRSNAGREPTFKIPVSLIVTDYQHSINAGGQAYTDTLGEPWVADQKYTAGGWGYFQKGSAESTKQAIANTSDPTLFKSARVDPYAYRYDNVPNGIYEIDLKFAEIVKLGKKERRVFDVVIEDSMVLPAHDIAYEVGTFTAEERTFFVPVADGRLDVRFIARAGFAKPIINSISVSRRPDK
jgi:subtilisin family serine protease